MKTFNLFDIDEPPQQPTQDTADTKDAKPIYNPIASQKEAEAQHRAACAAHQDAIKRIGMLRGDILKGIAAGGEPYGLLLKAIECISLMTGDKLFYEQSREDLKAIHGAGLLESLPLEMELDEVRQRLKMLTRPELEAEPPENRKRIESAVKAHKNRETYLLELIACNND